MYSPICKVTSRTIDIDKLTIDKKTRNDARADSTKKFANLKSGRIEKLTRLTNREKISG